MYLACTLAEFDSNLVVLGSVADPDAGSGTFLTPGSGIGKKKLDSDEHPGSYLRQRRNNFLRFKRLKFFDADPGSWMEKIRIRDGKNSAPM